MKFSAHCRKSTNETLQVSAKWNPEWTNATGDTAGIHASFAFTFQLQDTEITRFSLTNKAVPIGKEQLMLLKICKIAYKHPFSRGVFLQWEIGTLFWWKRVVPELNNWLGAVEVQSEWSKRSKNLKHSSTWVLGTGIWGWCRPVQLSR